MSGRPELDDGPPRVELERLIVRARLALLWEATWPALAALFVIAGLFVTVSWFGVWLAAPKWLRIAGLAAAAAALVWPLILLARASWPRRADALSRVDRDTGLPHRPASALDDRAANVAGDPAAAALWAIHQKRAQRLASRLRVAPPTSSMPARDRFAIRALVLVGVVASAFVAGPEKYARLAAAFDLRDGARAGAAYRIDAWIDPPAYTGRAPLLLRAATEDAQPTQKKVEAPAGSLLVVRTSDGSGVTVETQGGLTELQAEPGQNAAPRSPEGERKWTLTGDATVIIRRGAATVGAFALQAIPDRPPIASWRGETRGNGRGAVTLGYRLEDDYGVVGAELEFSAPSMRGRGPAARPLVEAPRAPLALASGAGGVGEAETTLDLSDHPWGGARVAAEIVARDEGGNTGRSDRVEIVLPQRPFVNPLARALVEQRRALVLYPEERRRVGSALRGLTTAPELFAIPAGHFLGLKAIESRLAAAKTDDDLREVADLMWQMALQLEEGGLSAAERDLQAAQRALREALERGASEDEIRQLMDQLRAALDRFLQELADQQQRSRDNAQDQSAPDPNERMITSQDLQRMLDQMEKMARSGNMADAQRMLEQLQNLLQNLQSARRDNGRNQMSREMNRSLNQLDQMMRDQQELRDRTFQQRRQRGQQEGQEQGDQAESLQQRQQALREQLEDLQQRMRRFGMRPEQGLEDAEGAMRDAEQQLGRGQEGQGQAVESQGRALEGLRQGAQSLAQQMQQGSQPGEQAGEGDPNGQGRSSRDSANPDPLGREARERGDQSRSQYDPVGTPAAQRAQRVLEELRRRLGDPSRPRDELDYFERLLRRY